MEIIKLLVVFLMSVVISRLLAFFTMMGYAFINKKRADVIFTKENSKKILSLTKGTFLVSAVISSLAAYLILDYLKYQFAIIIAGVMLAIKVIFFFYKFNKTGKDLIISRLS